jgi:hypothetical protein
VEHAQQELLCGKCSVADPDRDPVRSGPFLLDPDRSLKGIISRDFGVLLWFIEKSSDW